MRDTVFVRMGVNEVTVAVLVSVIVSRRIECTVGMGMNTVGNVAVGRNPPDLAHPERQGRCR